MSARPYDPDERHDTPLARVIQAHIKAHGPLPVADFFRRCLQDHAHGYYRHREAIGATGDFVTAPEISQCFGEILGAWVAVVWQQMGSPTDFNVVEVGPGRGTMMRDAVRTMRLVKGLLDAANICLVEPSPALAAQQKIALGNVAPARISWMGRIDEVRPAPTILIANEVLDTFPIIQWIYRSGAWHLRTVVLDQSGMLQFGHEPGSAGRPAVPAALRPPRDGDVLELAPAISEEFVQPLAALATAAPLAALLIDYGHMDHGFGDTLQAVRRHAYVHPLACPGESDVTAHVDFAQVAASARRSGRLTVAGAMPQGTFLGLLGAVERASRLMSLNPSQALAIEAGVKRLLDPSGMGSRFKVLALCSPDLPLPPPFEPLRTILSPS